MPRKKDRIPAPGGKKDPYTNFMKKSKWASVLRTSTLDIAGRNIQKEGAVIVAHALLKNIYVTTLNLTQNHLGDAGITEFSQMLKVNATVRVLHVGINDLTDVGGVMLASALLVNRTMLQVYAPGNSFGDDTACAFAHVLKVNRELRHVDLSWNAVGHKGAEAFANVGKINPDFTVNLCRNRISDDGAKAMCKTLKDFGRAELHNHVNWWQNDIGKAGALAIADLVEANTKLASLNLSWNSLGSDGGEALARALGVNIGEDPPQPFSTVTMLNLSENVIGDKAAIEFGRVLRLNPPLQNLNLSHNLITSDGAIAIFSALRVNTTLTSLNLSHNKISDPAVPTICDVITTTSTLQALWCQRNEISQDGKNVIQNSIPKATKMRINYGLSDDMHPYTSTLVGTYGAHPAHHDSRNSQRKYSSVSARSSETESRSRRSTSRRKSVSRGSTVSDSTSITSAS